MTKNIDHGYVDNSFESSEELVSDHGTKDRCEVAQHSEGVVDDSGFVFRQVKLLMKIDT